eukprot:m.363349 g.363349  ORF g.363349 m.363349 type:complete len:394 (+) comp22106_c0_seq1:62-1243(+)
MSQPHVPRRQLGVAASDVLAHAEDAAWDFGVIGSEHVLYGLLSVAGHESFRMLARLGWKSSALELQEKIKATYVSFTVPREKRTMPLIQSPTTASIFALAAAIPRKSQVTPSDLFDAMLSLEMLNRPTCLRMLFKSLPQDLGWTQSEASAALHTVFSQQVSAGHHRYIEAYGKPCAVPGKEPVADIRALAAKLSDWEDAPLPSTHWVVPGYLLCGSSPEQMQNQPAELQTLLDAGVTVFVSLQTRYPEYYSGDAPYYEVIGGDPSDPETSTTAPWFLHMPIDDFSVAPLQAIMDFLEHLVQLMLQGHTIYLHCFGGHGRTGTVASMMVSLLGQHNDAAALQAFKHLHTFRHTCAGSCHFLRSSGLEAPQQTKQLGEFSGTISTRLRDKYTKRS